jgi:hypothetical protein
MANRDRLIYRQVTGPDADISLIRPCWLTPGATAATLAAVCAVPGQTLVLRLCGLDAARNLVWIGQQITFTVAAGVVADYAGQFSGIPSVDPLLPLRGDQIVIKVDSAAAAWVITGEFLYVDWVNTSGSVLATN